MPSGADVVLTIVVYILEHRLFLVALNLVIGAVFVALIHSIPWLRKRGISYHWFHYFVREKSAVRSSSMGHIEAQQTYISLRTLSKSPSSSGTLSPPSNNPFLDPDTVSSSRTGLYSSEQSMTTFASESTSAILSRNGSDGSNRRLEIASTTRSPRLRPLEPLRRPVIAGDLESIDTRDTFPSHMTTPPLSISQTTNPGPRSVDLGELRAPETPVTPGSDGASGESPVLRSPGGNRPLTCVTTLSHQSIMTLPVYREAEDDRMSVASQAPTYKSTATTRGPRFLRFTRPPLPTQPPSSYPLAAFGGKQ